MPRVLCMTGMALSICVLVLALLDLVVPTSLAPYKHASYVLDVVFALCAVAVGYLCWATYREVK